MTITGNPYGWPYQRQGWVRSIVAVAFAFAVTLTPQPLAARAAETNPGVGYPPTIHIEQLLNEHLPVGGKVSVSGYPRCERSGCMLHDQLGAISQSVRVDSSGLPSDDRQRLIHCYEPNRESCVVVIYGRTVTDRVIAERIWWQSSKP